MSEKVSCKIILTEDGSPTVTSDRYGETYHSSHGAVQESNHVFLKSGLDYLVDAGKTRLKIFEMGFGTGLNVWLTSAKSRIGKISIDYHSIELYPLGTNEIKAYGDVLGVEELDDFWKIHEAEWDGNLNQLHAWFSLTKYEASLLEFELPSNIDLLYYDAFYPDSQPELWTADIFQNLFIAMNNGAVLVTYCCKGNVRRAMISVGFRVERIPGPPGKREMIRATKPFTSEPNS
jgi:tRNA U34 5-methylaminomethyl-2-thiouridine-forming methyltransferase MnmC